MRAFIIVATAVGVAFAGYGTPAGKDDYDEESYTKGAIVNNNAVNNAAYQPSYGSANPKPTYPSSYDSSDRVKSTQTNGYQAPAQTYAPTRAYAPAQSYAPVAPQTYSNDDDDNNNNAVKPSAYGRSQPTSYGSNGRSSARIAYGPTQSYEPAQTIEPYSFAYTAEDGDGSHSHSASSDAQGRVSGEYTIQLADGRNRVVKYTADERGYRADIVTNELGTESKNPADVTIQSSALTGEQAAVQYTQQYQRQIQSANYAFKGAARQTQPAYTPPAYTPPAYTAPAPTAARLTAPAPTAARLTAPAPIAARLTAPAPIAARLTAPAPIAARLTAPTPRVAAPAYAPVGPVSGRLSTPTTESTYQGDHNAGYNDATAAVDSALLRPAVEQVPQRTISDGGVKRRNKPSYG